MKNLLSYTCMAFLCCTLASSCINEYFDDFGSDKDATVELTVSMPSSVESDLDNLTKVTTEKEEGSSYENTIVGTNDIRIFAFDVTNANDPNTYETLIGEAYDLICTDPDASTVRLIKGKLPKQALGRTVKLVMMANYQGRLNNNDGTLDKKDSIPAPGTKKYSEWMQPLKFNYGDKPWSENDAADGKYIPMSGETILYIKDNSKAVNQTSIQLTRAIAKVRIIIKETSQYYLTNLQTNNAAGKSFDFAHYTPEGDVMIPKVTNGIYLTLNFPSLSVKPNKPVEFFEFYLPEQPMKKTTLQLGMTENGRLPGGDNTVQESLEFKDYGSGAYFPIERNYIYEFWVGKKKDETKADISIGIEPWIVEDEIISDYE